MPFNATSHIRAVGASLTGANVNQLLDDVTTVIGTGGAAQGIQDIDIPEGPNIPNRVLSLRTAYQRLVWEPNFCGQRAAAYKNNRVPPSTMLMPFAGALAFYDYSADAAVGFIVYRENLSVHAQALAATSPTDVVTRVTLATPQAFEQGQLITLTQQVGGSLPADGSRLRIEQAPRFTHISLWLRMDG